MSSCNECKFWDQKETRRAKSAAGIIKLANCIPPLIRALKPEFKGVKMFVQDGSDYMATLFTAADFFCAHFELKT